MTLMVELGIGYFAYALRTQVATEKITSLSEEYRDVARRGSLLYFVITDLHKMNSLYVYSLNAFVAIFQVRQLNIVAESSYSSLLQLSS